MAYISFQPSDFFNTVLYTGNGTNDTSITGVGFQPDWVWLKNRTSVGSSHLLADSNRGASQRLRSDTSDVEDANGISSFDTDGFTLTSGGNQNSNGANYVAWNWKANGGTTSSNTDGTITSTVQADTTSGFSVVTYTGNGTAGATIGHGLGVTPSMFIIKGRSLSGSWVTYHKNLGATRALSLQGTNAPVTSSAYFNNTEPTSSVITLGYDGPGNEVNNGGDTFVVYCFADIKGFSSFGTYTGNGSTNGSFCYTGFRPAFLIMKRIDTTENWLVLDSKRDVDNPVGQQLYPNLSAAEGTENRVDFVSNGFKLRNSGTICNASGGSYIYMAFAQFPFVTSTARPGTAR